MAKISRSFFFINKTVSMKNKKLGLLSKSEYNRAIELIKSAVPENVEIALETLFANKVSLKMIVLFWADSPVIQTDIYYEWSIPSYDIRLNVNFVEGNGKHYYSITGKNNIILFPITITEGIKLNTLQVQSCLEQMLFYWSSQKILKDLEEKRSKYSPGQINILSQFEEAMIRRDKAKAEYLIYFWTKKYLKSFPTKEMLFDLGFDYGQKIDN